MGHRGAILALALFVLVGAQCFSKCSLASSRAAHSHCHEPSDSPDPPCGHALFAAGNTQPSDLPLVSDLPVVSAAGIGFFRTHAEAPSGHPAALIPLIKTFNVLRI